MLYFLLQYTASHFAGVPALAAELVSYAHGLIYALSKDVKLHLLPRTQRWYLCSLTQPIQHIHQRVSDPSLCSLFAQTLEGEKCRAGAKFAIHKTVRLPDPCQLGRFPHFLNDENGGKMLTVVSWIREGSGASPSDISVKCSKLKTEIKDRIVTLDEYNTGFRDVML